MSELIVVRPEPLCAETPLELQDGILTPVSRFYVRNNFPIPKPTTGLTIDGSVAHSMELTLEELRKMPRHKLTATMECAGNGRSAMNPPVPGEQWGLGAVSTAEWEGMSLASVLRTALINPDAVEIVFHGADGFARSLPVQAAEEEDILLVDRMNGEPLTPEHGAPLRLLMPGWYGMASVKWLFRIEASKVAFKGHFQAERYVIEDRPVRTMQPRSLILDPQEGASVAPTRRLVRGVAWTGSGEVKSVEVSDDGGKSWAVAKLLGAHQPYTWRRWEFEWSPKQSGAALLLTRATDSTGKSQPLQPVWNALGYANNGVVPRKIFISSQSPPRQVTSQPRVDGDRMREDFEALSKIGATPEGGVNRPTFSDAHLAARKWFIERAESEGLETRRDAAGNHSAILHTRGRGDVPVLLLGSHLDSVPMGGRYDGAMGVVAAFHVLLATKAAGTELPFALEAIDFTDEEGTLMGLLGSEALAGTLTTESLQAPRGGREALLAGLAQAGLREDRLHEARRDRASLAGYLELHIEQGPRLEREGIQIGVVTAIVGSRSFRIVLRGHGGHAGTMPMDARRDAAVAAARIILAAREIVVADFPKSVITVGDVRLEPGAFNVVPSVAQLSLEFRSQDETELDAIEQAIFDRFRADAEAHGIALEVTPVARWQPTVLDSTITDVIERAAVGLGLTTARLPSGAGHDAQTLAPVTPTGMIFVPSVGGVSHGPHEYTAWDDVVNGANVLLGTVQNWPTRTR